MAQSRIHLVHRQAPRRYVDGGAYRRRRGGSGGKRSRGGGSGCPGADLVASRWRVRKAWSATL